MTQSQQIEARLAGVRFEGLKRVNPEYLVAKEHVKAGDVVDTVAISKEAQRMSALQDFESVGYRLDGDRESPTLTWLPREKNWGPNYLKLDLGAYASWDGDLTFKLYGRHVRTWVNSLGAEWRNEVQIGGETLVATSFFQPLDDAHRFFIEPRVAFSRSLEDVFQDDERVARYQFQDVTGPLDVGPTWADMRRRASATSTITVIQCGYRLGAAATVHSGRRGLASRRRVRQSRHGVQSDARLCDGSRIH